MFDAYIRSTYGLFKWLFFVLVQFIGPPFRTFFGWMGGLGLFTDIFLLLWLKHPFHEHGFWIMVFGSVLFMSLSIAITIGMEILNFDRGVALGTPYHGSSGERARNTVAGVGLFLLLSVGAYYWLHLWNGWEAGGVGLALFMGVGLALGVVRLVYQGGAGILQAASNAVGDLRFRFFSRQGKREEKSNVVQLVRRK